MKQGSPIIGESQKGEPEEKGEKGDKGEQGIQGVQGLAGFGSTERSNWKTR